MWLYQRGVNGMCISFILDLGAVDCIECEPLQEAEQGMELWVLIQTNPDLPQFVYAGLKSGSRTKSGSKKACNYV
jgi:hypothetical protein